MQLHNQHHGPWLNKYDQTETRAPVELTLTCTVRHCFLHHFKHIPEVFVSELISLYVEVSHFKIIG